IVTLLAILTAETIEAVTVRHRAAGLIAAAAGVAWLAHVAVVFSRSFEELEHDPRFIGSPSRDPARFFSPWWSGYAALRGRIERRDLLRRANGTIPEELLGGFYRLFWADEFNAVYVPTERDSRAFRTDPTRFLENVAHVARVSAAVENGVLVPPNEYTQRFP